MLSELCNASASKPEASIWSGLSHGHDLDPSKIALIAMHQPADHLRALVGPLSPQNATSKSLEWSYAQLKKGAVNLAAYFRTRDVPQGATVLTFIPNCAEWALLLWTAALGCHTIIALDEKALKHDREDELRYYLDKFSPHVVVVGGNAGIGAVERLRSSRTKYLGVSLKHAAHSTHDSWTSMPAIAQLFADKTEPEVTAWASDSLDRLVAVTFTSGTSSGAPKGCPITVRNLNACMAADVAIDRDAVGISNDDNFRSIALVMSHRLWYCGATLLLPDSAFSPSSTLLAIQRYQATVVGVVPVLTYLLFHDKDHWSREAVSSIKYVFVTGDVITTQHLARTKEVFPDARALCTWGMTEGVGVIGWPCMPSVPIPVHQGVASCGVVLAGAAVRIVDTNGHAVARGAPGELHVSGECMIRRYMDDVSSETFFTDGDGRPWFRTGDTAVMSEEGFCFIVGRTKDIIKSNGIALAPASIEHCLTKWVGIEACVIPLPAPIYGELPYAVVETLPLHITPSQCAQVVLRKLGRDYAIGGVLTLQKLGLQAWPRGGRNKISKAALKAAAWAARGEDVWDLDATDFAALAPILKFGGLSYRDFPNEDNWEEL